MRNKFVLCLAFSIYVVTVRIAFLLHNPPGPGGTEVERVAMALMRGEGWSGRSRPERRSLSAQQAAKPQGADICCVHNLEKSG